MTAATPPLVGTLPWTGAHADLGGDQIAYLEAGAGEPLVIVDLPFGGRSSLAPLEPLGGHRRLLAPQLLPEGMVPDGRVPDGSLTTRELARTLDRFTRALDLPQYAFVGRARGAAIGLWAAVDNPGRVSTLILESPALSVPPDPVDSVGESGPDADADLLLAMATLEVPTLVLLAHDSPDALPDRAGRYKVLPACTVALVYAAGDDVRQARPDLYVEAVSDYLRRGQAFIVSDRSSVIHP